MNLAVANLILNIFTLEDILENFWLAGNKCDLRKEPIAANVMCGSGSYYDRQQSYSWLELKYATDSLQ